jgi:hypothetical protein
MTPDEGNEFIDQFLIKNKISLLTIAEFGEEHIAEIEQAENMFDLKDEKDRKLCLALFRFMAEADAPAIIESFCERYNIADSPPDDGFFEQNKIFLTAAFIYNPSFYAMSCNICGIIRSHLAYEAEERGETPETENAAVIFIVFHRNIHVVTASGADEVLREIWSEDIDQDGIKGKLRILANNKDNAGLAQFRFKFNEYYSEPPYYLRIQYTTDADKVERTAELNTIAVNSGRSGELVIASQLLDGIPYGEGLTFNNIVIYKHD